MLAGRMKLNTFLLLVGAGFGAIGAGGAVWWSMRPEPVVVTLPEAPLPDVATRPGPAAPAAPANRVTEPADVPAETTPPSAPGPSAASAPAPRKLDGVVLSYKGRDIGTDKLKDVTKGQDFKVNVYQDAGQATVNRAKIDLDRDDKWDEKITFEEGKITRQVAPADDEVYTQTFHWDGSGWVPEGG